MFIQLEQLIDFNYILQTIVIQQVKQHDPFLFTHKYIQAL